MVFETKGQQGRALLAGWLAWAQRSRLPEFVKLAKTIKKYRTLIHNTLDTGSATPYPKPRTPTYGC